jgi:multiple sugar transport system permease protein
VEVAGARERPASEMIRLWQRSRARLRRYEETTVAALFLTPDILGLVLFVVVPVLFAVYVSLFRWDGLGQMAWVGSENYRQLWADPKWWSSLQVTGVFAVLHVPLLLVASLGLALLVNRKIRARTFFRTAYFVPVAISLVIMSILWGYILEPSFGVLNYLLGLLGIPPQPWLSSVEQALPTLVAISAWKFMGYYMVIFLAGLQAIPGEYYEAARVDGAGRWQTFRSLTLPLLKPVTFFVLVIIIIRSFQIFDQVYVLTQGGPAYSTYVIVYYIYELAFRHMKLGYASAASVVLFALLLVLTLIANRLFRSGAVD